MVSERLIMHYDTMTRLTSSRKSKLYEFRELA